ncbi:MAG: NfeD family protein, partial [Planctomycetota bacterium]
EAQRDLTYGLATLLLAFTTAGVGLWFVSKRIGAVPIFRRYVMTEDDGPSGTLIDAMRPAHGGLLVGQEGTATTALRPAGKAEFGDDLFDVVSDLGVIDAGEPVRIAALDGFRIVVVPASASDDQQHSDQASTPDGDTA